MPKLATMLVFGWQMRSPLIVRCLNFKANGSSLCKSLFFQFHSVYRKAADLYESQWKGCSAICHIFKVPLANLIIVHDDLDMNVGRLKLVKGGGAGGHNGIRSLIAALGGSGFYRMKIGIGRPGNGDTPAEMPVERFVLAPFGKTERTVVENRLPEVVKGMGIFFREGPSQAMNYLNRFK